MRTPRILLTIAIAALLWYAFAPRALSLWESLSISEDDNPVHRARQVTTFVLHEDSWIEFEAPRRTESLQIVTVGDLHSSHDGSVEDIWEYAVAYQLLDSQGKLLDEGVHHFRTGYTDYIDRELGKTEPGSFYVGLPLRPLDGRMMVLKLRENWNNGVLLLRTAAMPEDFANVTARVYAGKRTETPPSRFAWRRLSKNSRKRLAMGNVYSDDLLTESEKTNILWNLNERVAPRGMPGVDFEVRNLYILQERGEEDSADPAILPPGSIVHPRLHGIVPAPVGEGVIRFDFTPIELGGVRAAENPFHIHYYGKNLHERQVYQFPVQNLSYELTGVWDAGIFEVVPPSLGAVRAYYIARNATTEITPDAEYLRAYRSSEGERIDFGVLHENGRDTPMRVDIRVPSTDNWSHDSLPMARIRYDFINSMGNVVTTGELLVETPPSIFDRMSETEEYPSLSEAKSYFFLLPENVSGIRLATIEGSVLVAAYNRPPALPRVTFVPESYESFAEDRPSERTWFYLPPREAERLMQENRAVSLVIQKRPPIENEYLESGEYSWESLRPDSAWTGRELLVPRSAAEIRRLSALSSVYREIQTNVPQTLDFVSILGDGKTKSTMIVLRESSEPVGVEVFIDDIQFYKGEISVSLAEIDLPAVPAGEHRIVVRTSTEARFLINCVQLENGAVYQRLTALRVEDADIPFHFVKEEEGDETLTGRFFSARGAGERTELEVILKARRTGRQPFTALTLEDRLFDIKPAVGEKVYALYADRVVLNEGQRFFIPLGADLAVGEYRLIIRKRSGPDGCLLLTRILPDCAKKDGLSSRRDGNPCTRMNDALKTGNARNYEE